MPDSSSDRPEDVRLISGVLLVSRQPERLMAFHHDVLPLAEERNGDTERHWGASWAMCTSPPLLTRPCALDPGR
jgi:hypothetical protein